MLKKNIAKKNIFRAVEAVTLQDWTVYRPLRFCNIRNNDVFNEKRLSFTTPPTLLKSTECCSFEVKIPL